MAEPRVVIGVDLAGFDAELHKLPGLPPGLPHPDVGIAIAAVQCAALGVPVEMIERAAERMAEVEMQRMVAWYTDFQHAVHRSWWSLYPVLTRLCTSTRRAQRQARKLARHQRYAHGKHTERARRGKRKGK